MGASQAGGLREKFGTMTKPVHAGRAAEAGIIAADLTDAGWTAAEGILESPRGFFQAHGGGFALEALSGRLGDPWTFADPGISIKPHPSGSLTHPGMTRMMELILEHDIHADEVEQVNVGTNHNMPNALIHHRPTDELQAKFSMEFCMASLLLRRCGGLAECTDEVVNSPEVQEMIRRVEFGVHPEAEAAGYDKMPIVLAAGVAALAQTAWPIFAPFIGGLGAFVAGSNTVSNMMFSLFQFGVGQRIGADPVWMVALQAVGGAAGNMICVHNVVAASAVAGLVGKEGAIIRLTLLPFTTYALLAGALGYAIVWHSRQGWINPGTFIVLLIAGAVVWLIAAGRQRAR